MSQKHAAIIGITESSTEREKIKEICVNYMKMLIKCADDEFKKKFLKYPHYYLNEEVGMTIPESVGIIFDAGKNAGRSASVYIRSEDGDVFSVVEGFYTVNMVEHLHNGTANISEEARKVGGKEVDIHLPEHLKGCKVVVKLPFFDIRSDMISDVKFEDGAEIVLTCA